MSEYISRLKKVAHKAIDELPLYDGSMPNASLAVLKLIADYDALAQQLAVAKVQLQTTQIALQDSNGAVVDLRQQLAAVQPHALKAKLACADLRIAEIEQQLVDEQAHCEWLAETSGRVRHESTRLEVQLAASQADLAECKGALELSDIDNHRLRVELTNSQTECADLLRARDSRVTERLARMDEAQATITRLEAMVAKGIDLDYQRRQKIAGAVGLLRNLHGIFRHHGIYPFAEIDAYLSKHEEKGNE